MWECKNCGETVEDEFETCWNCQTNPTSPDAENEDVAHASGQLGNNEHQERGGSAAGFIGPVLVIVFPASNVRTR